MLITPLASIVTVVLSYLTVPYAPENNFDSESGKSGVLKGAVHESYTYSTPWVLINQTVFDVLAYCVVISENSPNTLTLPQHHTIK